MKYKVTHKLCGTQVMRLNPEYGGSSSFFCLKCNLYLKVYDKSYKHWVATTDLNTLSKVQRLFGNTKDFYDEFKTNLIRLTVAS